MGALVGRRNLEVETLNSVAAANGNMSNACILFILNVSETKTLNYYDYYFIPISVIIG